jgi:hypothetical protein
VWPTGDAFGAFISSLPNVLFRRQSRLIESSRVPLFISWPGKILANTKVEEKVSHLDVSFVIGWRQCTSYLVYLTSTDLFDYSSSLPFSTMSKLENSINPMEKAFDRSLSATRLMWNLTKM